MTQTSRALALLLALVGCDPAASPTYPERRGGRGDPCLVVNDCKKPLLCLAGVCLDGSLSEKPTGKVCVAVECFDDKDCCPPQSKPMQEYCDELKGKTDSASKRAYSWDCACESRCKAHMCSEDDRDRYECDSTTDCKVGACKSNVCVECSKDADCGAGFLCDAQKCKRGCRRDEECGALEACEDARCVARDCSGNRQCIDVLGYRAAECRDGDCVIPCDNDAACNPYYTRAGAALVCKQGICTDIGCKTHFDCQSTSSLNTGLAACVSAEEAMSLPRQGGLGW